MTYQQRLTHPATASRAFPLVSHALLSVAVREMEKPFHATRHPPLPVPIPPPFFRLPMDGEEGESGSRTGTPPGSGEGRNRVYSTGCAHCRAG